MRLLFSSDVHGNLTHVRKILNAAKHHDAIALLGGDICPRRGTLLSQYGLETDDISKTVELQRLWFRDSFLPLARQYRNDLIIFLILGNSDCAYNLDLYQEYCRKDQIFVLKSGDVVKIPKCDNVYLMVSSLVTPSYHALKDHERIDTADLLSKILKSGPIYPKQHGFSLKGIMSREDTLIEATIPLEMHTTIEAHLQTAYNKFKDSNPIQPHELILMTHGPPINTALDMIKTKKRHVGSMAVRKFLQKQGVFLCLSGHIHETVEMSGNFHDTITNFADKSQLHFPNVTHCYSAGNNFKKDDAYCILVDTEDYKNGKRLKL